MTAGPRRRELFVWYRVEAERAAQARARVEAMQRSLVAGCSGLHARLLIRDDGAGEQTWMETYAMREPMSGAEGIDATLQAKIEAAAAPLRVFLAGDRHLEGFDLVSDC